jgi:hypothetical protein
VPFQLVATIWQLVPETNLSGFGKVGMKIYNSWFNFQFTLLAEDEEDENDYEVLSIIQQHTADVKFVQWHPREDVSYHISSYDFNKFLMIRYYFLVDTIVPFASTLLTVMIGQRHRQYRMPMMRLFGQLHLNQA